MAADDGGPAYPQGHMDGPHVDPSGMTLLDHFAGEAMKALIASSSPREHDLIARAAYDYAESMIAEKRRREQRT